jgi:hypothetical protein
MPKYFSIKIKRNSRQSKNTRIAATKYRLNQEIRFLCCNKQKLNELLYKIHLACAYYWNIVWQDIQTVINSHLDKMMDSIYQKHNKKTGHNTTA